MAKKIVLQMVNIHETKPVVNTTDKKDARNIGSEKETKENHKKPITLLTDSIKPKPVVSVNTHSYKVIRGYSGF